MDPNIAKIQVVHNDLLRVIYGKTRQSHTNMQKLREEHKIMSINQLSIYHVAMDMFHKQLFIWFFAWRVQNREKKIWAEV